MSKIPLDKYYTSDELAKYCVEKTKEIIGDENITEYLEPSAGSGVFLKYLDKPYLAYDIKPEGEGIIKQDYLTLDLEYKKGRCVIGNPPFGDRCNLYRKFYNKSVEISEYIAFISPIKMFNNTRQNYKYDLIYSEDLGLHNYSNISIHCCFNIYKRPTSGLHKRINYKLKDISIYREDDKMYEDIKEDFKICRMGQKTWKVLEKGQTLRNFKVVVHNEKYKEIIIQLLTKHYYDIDNRKGVISTPYIVKSDVYKYIKEQIPEIE